MAYSYVRYSGNGSTTNYTFSFPTISTDHIKVRVNGTLVTNWSFLNSSTIQFAAAPASGAVIEIRRETPKDSTIVNFTDGSVLLERDLDLLATWQLYLGQETEDDIEDTIRVDSQSRFDAQNRRIINVADPINAQDAVTKVYADAVIGQATAAASAAAAVQVALAADEAIDSAASALAAASSAAASGTSATNAASSASAAAASYDSFDDRYLGAKAVAPTMDNDGNALLTGAIYWSTSSNEMFVWSGSSWGKTFVTGSVARSVVTATAGQTLVPTPTYTIGANTLQVFVNGVKLLITIDYTETSQSSITMTAGLTSGDEVELIAVQPFAIGSTGAQNVSFTQAGTGAVSRTAQDELRETVKVTQFGGVADGSTDSATAINNAITALSALGGGDVLLPAGTIIVGATIYVADNVRLRGAGQKATTIKLKASANVNIIEQKVGAIGLGMGLLDLTVDGNQANNTQGGVYLAGVTDQRGPSWQIERVRITKCRNSVMASGVKAAFYIGGNTWHVIRDFEVVGNDYAQIAYWHGAADSKVDGVYLGANGYSFGSTAYGLFVTSAGNFFNNCYFGGTQPGPQLYFTGASAGANKFVGCIVDNAGGTGVRFVDGANNNQFIGGQIGNSSYSDGGTYYLVHNDVTNGRNMFVGVKFYSDYATARATHGYFESAGVNGAAQLIGCEFAGTYITSAVQIPGSSTTQFVGCKGYDITNVGTLKASTRVNVEGPYPSSAPSTSSVPLSRFNGGGAMSLWAGTYAYSYAWLQAIQDDGSNNLKNLYLNPLGGGVAVGGNLVSTTDNTAALGAAGARWSVVYAGTGTINTSDEREKQDISNLDATEKRVATSLKSLVKKFRFRDAVTSKGDAARIHIGVIAQEVISAFQVEGLDADRYGIICYDEWQDQYEDAYDDQGNPTGEKVLVTTAGNRYGVRYEELFAFIISAL